MCILASHIPSGPAALDLAISVNNSYRPLTLTEKVFHNDWQAKASISTQNPKDLTANKQKTGMFSTLTSNPLDERQLVTFIRCLQVDT